MVHPATSKDPRSRERQELAQLVESCLTRGTPHEVNLSVPRHGITSPVLRDAAYRAEYRGKTLPVVFTDGSHPPPFPVGVLSGLKAPPEESKEAILARQDQVLKVGTMSMRHPGLDYLIDLYVCRNTELAREDSTSADVEHLAFDRTMKFLADPAIDSVQEIWAYHTGFEPMIVGFYRGVTRSLEARHKSGKKPILIRPWFFEPAGPRQRHDEEDGYPRYSPESADANPVSYTPYPPWF